MFSVGRLTLIGSRLGESAVNGRISQVLKRNLRADKMIFRTSLPKYRVKLDKIPPLTKLLTEFKDERRITLEDAIRIRQEKLEVYKAYLPTYTNSTLLERIFHPETDVDSLLRIIDDNLASMTSFYIGVSFEALDDMMRAKLCEKATVMVAPEFKRLCKKALYKLRFFESDEVLKLMKCLGTLKLREGTLLVEAGLQMTRHMINDFSFEELRTLRYSLNQIVVTKLDNTSLLAALKDAVTMAEEKLIVHNREYLEASSELRSEGKLIEDNQF